MAGPGEYEFLPDWVRRFVGTQPVGPGSGGVMSPEEATAAYVAKYGGVTSAPPRLGGLVPEKESQDLFVRREDVDELSPEVVARRALLSGLTGGIASGLAGLAGRVGPVNKDAVLRQGGGLRRPSDAELDALEAYFERGVGALKPRAEYAAEVAAAREGVPEALLRGSGSYAHRGVSPGARDLSAPRATQEGMLPRRGAEWPF